MRRKIGSLLVCLICICFMAVPFNVCAKDVKPSLNSIEFKYAEIDGKFSSDVYEYGLTLKDSEKPPTLQSYEINGEADIFISYTYDNTNHQTGLTATLQYDTGSTIYNFVYTNPAEYIVNSNNLLSYVYCNYGEIKPAINDEDTAYKLYIPSDLTDITITPVTKDINAYCSPVELTLDDSQEPKITLYCMASDGSKREYSLDIKRVDKTMQQVRYEMEQEGYTSFVEGTQIYQKPEFSIVVCASAAGIVIIVLMFFITKRVAVNPYDKEEKPFYSPVE